MNEMCEWQLYSTNGNKIFYLDTHVSEEITPEILNQIENCLYSYDLINVEIEFELR